MRPELALALLAASALLLGLPGCGSCAGGSRDEPQGAGTQASAPELHATGAEAALVAEHRAAYDEAARAFDHFVTAEGRLGREAGELRDERARAVRAIADYRPKNTTPRAAAGAALRAEQAHARALEREQDPARRILITEAHAAWRAYRDAEIAFYVDATGSTQGHEAVKHDLMVTLCRRRVAMLDRPRDAADAGRFSP